MKIKLTDLITEVCDDTELREDNPKQMPAGLDKFQTMQIAKKVAQALENVENTRVSVNPRTLAPDSFDLNMAGVEYDGGSYNIFKDGTIKNMAVTVRGTNEPFTVGTIDSTVEDFMDNIMNTELKKSSNDDDMWVDPAGGTHYGDDDPAAMYELMDEDSDMELADTTKKPKIKYAKTVSKSEWDKTHKDYKSMIDGEHYMMFMRDGSTVLAPVKIEG